MRATPTPATQDPTEDARVLERAIGRQVRAIRLARGLTVARLSDLSGLSPGMVSKIENGATSASLTSLSSLAAALKVPMTMLFRCYDEATGYVRRPEAEPPAPS